MRAPPHADELPPLDPAVAVPDWRAAPRLTMCVIDGPGDAGFLIQSLTDDSQSDAMSAWIDDVEAADGLVVAAVGEEVDPAAVDVHALAAGDARGGFVRYVPPGGS